VRDESYRYGAVVKEQLAFDRELGVERYETSAL
jgi:hypothetical protein